MRTPRISTGLCISVLLFAPFGQVTIASAQTAPPPQAPPSYEPPPEPVAPPPYGRPRRAAPTEVEFAPDEPDLQLYSMSGAEPFAVMRYRRHFWGGYYGVGYGWAPVYSPVCGQPCRTGFVPGNYRLALSKDGGPVVPVWGATAIRGPSVLRASYTDRGALRATGWVVGIAGLVGGIVMIAASVHAHEECDPSGYCFEHDTADGGLLVGGIGVIVASGIVGGILISQRDQAFITVEPLRLSSFKPRESIAAAGDYPRPDGAMLALHF